MEGWISTKDASKQFNINPATLRRWCNRKDRIHPILKRPIKVRHEMKGNIRAMLFNVDDVRKIVAEGVKPGRPTVYFNEGGVRKIAGSIKGAGPKKKQKP